MKNNFKKVYKRNGMNCVDLNNIYTFLPDDLSKIDGIYINNEFYVKVKIVKTTV